MSTELERVPSEHSVMEAVKRPAKIVGATVLSGIAGYAAAKGVESFLIPVDPSEVFEATVVLGSAALGGFITTEAVE